MLRISSSGKISNLSVIILLFMLVFYVLAIYLSNTDPEFFLNDFIVEDGLIEWLTVLALLTCSLWALVNLIRLRSKRNFKFLLTLGVIAAGMFFGAGEEISWGQRILGIQPSDFFIENNAQGETNFHNLVVNGIKINKLVFSLILFIGIVLYILVVPLLYNRGNFRKFFNKWGVPVPELYQTIAFFVFFFLTELIPLGKKAEMMEFAGAFMFVQMFLLSQNRDIYKTSVKDPSDVQ